MTLDPDLLRQAERAHRIAADVAPDRRRPWETLGGIPVETWYGPASALDRDPVGAVGLPGQYPYTRGIHATGYRGKPWTIRQFAGFGSPADTNARFRYLLEHGETGLSVAFDLPTLMGQDSDAPMAKTEVGKVGVAVSSVRDMERLFEGIPLDKVTASMTINGPAAAIWAMYLVVAERQGVPSARVGGTLQNDILKEYIAQNEYLYPPTPSLRLVVDTIEYATRACPKWNPISVSGYHIREAGSTAAQELAFTLANGFCYVESCLDRGLGVDEFAPRFSFFWNAHNDLFEEVAKYRAARRIWARHLRERYNAANPRSWWHRFHTQTAGQSLTAQQPENNVIRVALQALAAVLGGTNSLHTNALDEALSLPSEQAARLALRTQQIIAAESGVTAVTDPLGGSYFVEMLTDTMERLAEQYFARIAVLGGVVAAIEDGFFQREIAEASYRFQQQVESGAQEIVGLNVHQSTDLPDVPILRVDPVLARDRAAALDQLRADRDNGAVGQRLDQLRRDAAGSVNVMPALLEAVRADATLGEIGAVFSEVFGGYQEQLSG